MLQIHCWTFRLLLILSIQRVNIHVEINPLKAYWILRDSVKSLFLFYYFATLSVIFSICREKNFYFYIRNKKLYI